MKELKLKALIKEENRIGDVVEINFSKGECMVGFGDPDEDNPEGWGGYASKGYLLPEVELLEYTGLKDQNGIQIFEGDIVEYTRPDISSSNYGMKSKHRIFFENGGFMIEFPTNMGGTCGLDLRVYNKNCEVIGNIHQNPELLKP